MGRLPCARSDLLMIQKLFGGFVVGLVVSLLLSMGTFIEWRSATSGPDINLMAEGCGL
jgi:hypothetical protein